jgi:hypothetical protein
MHVDMLVAFLSHSNFFPVFILRPLFFSVVKLFVCSACIRNAEQKADGFDFSATLDWNGKRARTPHRSTVCPCLSELLNIPKMHVLCTIILSFTYIHGLFKSCTGIYMYARCRLEH